MHARLVARSSTLLLVACVAAAAGCASEEEPAPEAPPAMTDVTPAPATEAPPPASAPEPEPPTPPAPPPQEKPPQAKPEPKPEQAKPEPKPPQATPPEPLPDGTPLVTFVRVASLSVGGDFDSSGDEEVVVEVEVDGASQLLLERGLDLPDDSLETFDFEESEWLELPEKAEVSLDLSLVESDVTENETMCGTDRAVVVKPTAAGPTESSIEVPLSTIRGESSGLFQATKRFVIEEPRLELRLVRVQRRDAPDAPGRRLVTEAFAGLDQAAPPTKTDQAPALRERVTGWSLAADRTGARSTHTWARKTLAALEAEADALVNLLLAAEPVDEELHEKREALGRAVEALEAEDRKRAGAGLQKIARAVETAPESSLASLAGLRTQVEEAQAALKPLDDLSPPLQTVSDALDEYEQLVDQAHAAAEALARVGPALKSLQAHVAAAAGAK